MYPDWLFRSFVVRAISHAGLVVTSRITHATPAAFSSHVSDRDEEYDIAQQQALNQTLDVLFGGGLEKYTDRPDGVNLLQVMEQRGYQVLTSYKGAPSRLCVCAS